MKNRKPENEEEGVGEPVYLTLETWGISRHCIQRVVGIKNQSHIKKDIYMGSYFNFIGVNYFNENINDLYRHIFVSKLIKICKLSI